MSIYVNNTFRIKRNALQQEAMKKLTDAKIFDGYKDILMISAVIGYSENKYVPIEKTASDGVLMQFFSEKDYDIMDLIAYAHEKDQRVIKSDKKYEIFANYANGGFPILLDKLDVLDKNEIDSETTRKALIRYYMLLLSNGFKAEELKNEDLLI